MQEPPTTPTGTPRVLLIDLDNCPQQLNQLPSNLAGFRRIVVCYGSQEPKLSLGLVTALAEPILGGHLEIVGMEKNGRNAADFGLCFHAGKLMADTTRTKTFRFSLYFPINNQAFSWTEPCPCGSGKKYKKCCLP